MDTGWLLLPILGLLVLFQAFYFKIAARYRIVDVPNARSAHQRVVWRGGGVVIVAGVWLYAAFWGFSYPWFLGGLTLAAGVSMADDVHPLPPAVRLGVQLLAVLMLFYQVSLFPCPVWKGLVLCVVVVGILNAFNFMDGINGMSGAYSMVLLGALWWLNRTEAFVDSRFIYVLLLALLVFNFCNFRKRALCFAGDVGAVGMGYCLLFLIGLLILKTGQWGYVVFLAVYGVDSVLTIVYRLWLREPIFAPHRHHLYQFYVHQKHIPHLVVSSCYAFLQAVVCTGAILSARKGLYACLVFSLLAFCYVLLRFIIKRDTMKRCFDLGISLLALLVLIPLFLVMTLWRLAFFQGHVVDGAERIGRHGRPFKILTFSRCGRGASRLYRLLELVHVPVGQMSLVGPRPESAATVQQYTDEEREVLMLRPGMADPASMKYRHEHFLTERAANAGISPDAFYKAVVTPDRVQINVHYAQTATLWSDVGVMIKTVFGCC